MFKRKLTTGELFLIIVNLVPLFGVWFEGWDAKMIFIVYCLETVVVGLVNVLKMAGVTIFVHPKASWEADGKVSMVSGWFFIIFFILHYGFFVFVQTQIFFAFSGIGAGIGQNVYKNIPAMLGDQGKLLLCIFVVYYTLQTIFGFFSNGEYQRTSMMQLMFQPYGRIFIQQFIVIMGSMFLLFGAGKIFILVFVIIKMIADIYMNMDNIFARANIKMQEQKKENR